MVGIVALFDKPRPDTPQFISDLKRLGISVKMLTGDALPIAREVATKIRAWQQYHQSFRSKRYPQGGWELEDLRRGRWFR
ncbi:MAG: hypothetical protein ACUVTL_00080 [Thermoproteota archaeon]